MHDSSINTPFLRKLNHILEEPEFAHMISWDETGTMVDILDESAITSEILPKFFRHNKFESFIRQLNLYGFKKIKKTNLHRFRHPDLVKGKSIFTIKSQRRPKSLSSSPQEALSQREQLKVSQSVPKETSKREPDQGVVENNRILNTGEPCPQQSRNLDRAQLLNMQLLNFQNVLVHNNSLGQFAQRQPQNPILSINSSLYNLMNPYQNMLSAFQQNTPFQPGNMFFYH